MIVMTTALTLLLIALVTMMALLALAVPHRARYSAFERKRRQKEGEDTAQDDRRERRYQDIMTMRALIAAVLGIFIVMLCLDLFGWFFGFLIALGLYMLLLFVERSRSLGRFAQRLYNEQEHHVLRLAEQCHPVLKYVNHRSAAQRPGVDSKQELEHLIQAAGNILSDEEKRLLIGGLQFEERRVRSIMTHKKDIFSIRKTEILGPLVLDDLHRSGHDSFPVTNGGGNDDIVGILRLRDVQTLDTTRRHTAKVETAMDPDVRAINQDEPLAVALNLLLDSQHHLLIVTNDDTQTVGLVTLRDIIKTLLGR
jgi:CBS domain containing-hemolysin-like protein